MMLRAVCGLLLGLSASSCIERQHTGEPAATGTPAPTIATAPTVEVPTGKYGQVKGVELVPGGIRSFVAQGKTERVSLSMVSVEGQPFTEALRAEVKAKSGTVWDVQVQVPVAQPVAANDVILATFWAKTERSAAESAEGQTELVMELGREPWSKSVSYPLRAGSDWKQVFVRFKAQQAYAAGESQLIFRLGYEPQTILIGGVTVENFGKQLALADLPTTKITYPGNHAVVRGYDDASRMTSSQDWLGNTTTFGYNMFLFPVSKWVGGILFEHTHRLMGSLVGFLTIILAVWLWLSEDRRWLRNLGVIAVIGVILQGVLGGLRVTMMKDQIGIFHACVAQAFLVLLVFIALTTTRSW